MSGGAGVLLEGVVRGGAVLLLALAFARVRSVSAGTRHVALAAVLAWVIVLPLQVAIGPEWRLTVLPPEPIDARPSEDAPVTLASSRAPPVAVSPSERGVVTGPSSKAPSVAARAEGLASREGAAARSRGGPPRGADVDDRSLRARIVDLVLPVYLGGVALLLLLRVVGMLRIRGIRSRSRAASERIERAAVLAADRLRVPVVRPRISDECSLPFVAGLLRPGIVLPSSAAGWPPERLEAVLLHEMAHVRRRDPLTGLIVDLGRAAGWPIPFAWIAARRARSLAEQACDEAVIRAGITRERYADALVELARRARGARLLTAAPGMAAESDLAERVEVLLTGSASSRPSRTLAAACGVAALVVGVLAGACVPTRGASGFDGTPAGTSNVSDGGADLSTNAAGLQTRWSEDGRHAGVFVTGDVDIGRVLAGEADASAGQSVVAMSEDASGRIRAFAWPGDAIEQAPWARRTLAIAARRISDVDFGTGPPRSDAAGGGGQGGV
ncbi:MAG: M56 family metallopeptidase, partial [Gemmatimonadota bacterium]